MKPKCIDMATQAFPARIGDLMPDLTSADAEPYRRNWHNGTTWGFQLFNDLFYKGVKGLIFIPKPDIDPAKAFTHIKTIMRSFEPSHEDKTAACAYLFELWFESAQWEAMK